MPNISGMTKNPTCQAESLTHHNLGHRPKTKDNNHNLGHRPMPEQSRHEKAASLTHYNLGHRPKIKNKLCK